MAKYVHHIGGRPSTYELGWGRRLLPEGLLEYCVGFSPDGLRKTTALLLGPTGHLGLFSGSRLLLTRGRHCPDFPATVNPWEPITATATLKGGGSQIQDAQVTAGMLTRYEGADQY